MDKTASLSCQDRQLLNAYQQEFPLVSEPYKEMAAYLGMTEGEVLERLRSLEKSGIISRVGVVFRPRSVGTSTLAAMEVPASEVERVAALVSAYPEVNHNYEREHTLNLWFVLTANDKERLQNVMAEIAKQSGMTVHAMPMVEDYHIDLGFPLN